MQDLRVLELEDRRVLSGLPAVFLSEARELVLTAGSRANDGQPDTFMVRGQGEDLQVSLDGETVYQGRLADLGRMRIEGSGDPDTVIFDFSSVGPGPPQGGGDHTGTGSPDSAAALAMVGGPISTPLDIVVHGGAEDTITLAGSIDLGGGSLDVAGGTIYVDGSIQSRQATVDLRATDALRISGTIDVADYQAGQHGGAVGLFGKQIDVVDGARIDASGDAGGGTVRIGGGLRGLDASVPSASTTRVDAGATIWADAVSRGDGGSVIVWAEETTSFSGTISAHGGLAGGQGGLVEVSAHGSLAFGGWADISAPSGPAGTLLLDPTTIVIDSAYAAILVAELNSGNVTLSADEIFVESAVDASGNAMFGTSLELHAGTITFSNAANLITQHGDLLLDGNVVLENGAIVALSTGWAFGGNLTVLGSVDGIGGAGNQRLELIAGSGIVTIGGNVGANDAIGTLSVEQSGSFSMGGAVLAGELNVTSSGAVAISGQIRADGGVTVHADSTTLGDDVVTDGAAIFIDSSVALVSFGTITLDTTNAGLRAGESVSLGAISGGAASLTIRAGSGNILVTGAIDQVQSLELDSTGETTLRGPIGAIMPLGSLVTDAGGTTYVNADVTTSGGTQIYNDAVVLTNNVTLTDTGLTGIFFNGTVDGDTNGPWNLTVVTTRIGSQVQFNDAVGSGHLIGRLTVDNAGLLAIGPDADITLEGFFAQVGGGPVRIAGDVATAGFDVSFSSAVRLTGDVSISTGGGAGNITFDNTVDGVGLESLALSAASGNIVFAQGVGGFTPLEAITIHTAGDVTFDGPVAAGSLLQLAGEGTTTLRGNVVTSAAEGIDLTAPNVVLDGLTIIATGDGLVRFNAAVDMTGDVVIDAQGPIRFEGTLDSSGGGAHWLRMSSQGDIGFFDAVGSGTASELGAITIITAANVEVAGTLSAASLVQLDGTGATTISGDVTTSAAEGVDLTLNTRPGDPEVRIMLGDVAINATGGGIARFNAPVELHGAVTINAEGSITFESTLISPGSLAQPLTLASDADIAFHDAVGAGPGNLLGAVTITTARDVTADGTITAASLVQLAGSGTTLLTDDVTTSAAEGIDLSAARILLDGLRLLAQDDGIVRMNGPVELGGDVAINAANGGILFTALATVDGQVGEHNNLTLSAGWGSVSFNADIGDDLPIGDLTITQADAGVTFGGSGGGDFGPVARVRTLGNINIGSEATIIDEISLDAGDGNTIAIVTAGGSVRFNGFVELRSDASVDTSDAGNTPGADIRFTRDALIDSQGGENNGLTLSAGADGSVSFNADIGSAVALSQLVVATAHGVAFGNDVSLADSDLAPIAVVRIDGVLLPPGSYGIDIGGVTAIGEGGIGLNAGDGNAIAFATTGQAVRMNGAVTLQSDASIDTTDGGVALGAEIRFTVWAAIDSQGQEYNDLVLTAGEEGVVSFNADIGSTAALGQLIVTSARGVAFGNDADAADPDLAPLTTVRVDGDAEPAYFDNFDINIGSNSAIGDGGIAFNGGNGNTLTLVTTGDRVRINGAVELRSDARIDTTDAGQPIGAEIRFTTNAPIDSQRDEINGLTLSAGPVGTVNFNADIGAVAALGHLIVTEAYGVALGNESSLSDADLGPVSAVWVDGDASTVGGYAFDIGSASPIGEGGIALNAGAGNVLSIYTTADGARMSGAVELQSDVWIDTTALGIDTAGADILIEGTMDGLSGGPAENLTLISHGGSITVTGAVGANVPLGELTLQNDLPESTGPAVFLGEVHANALTTFSQPYAVEFLGGGSINETVEFLNTGGVTVGDSTDDDFTFGQGVISTASDTSLGGTVRVLDQGMDFAVVRVIADTQLLTAGGDIAFAGTIDSESGEHNDLDITAGLGAVTFNGDIGGSWPLNHLVVQTARTVVFGDAAAVQKVMAEGGIDLGAASAIADGIFLNGGTGGLLTLGTSGGVVRLNGAVDLQSDVAIDTTTEGATEGAEIRFTANAPVNSDPGESNRLTLTAGTDGLVSFNANIGDPGLGAGEALKQLIVVSAGGVAFGNDASVSDPDLAPITLVRIDGDPANPGAFAIDLGRDAAIGDAGITLNGDDAGKIEIITTGDKVRFNGAVTLQGDVTIDTSDSYNSSGAEIRFTLNAPIDSQLGESNRLTLNAGDAGKITFNGDIGVNEAPGALIVTDAKGVVFGGEQLPDFAPLTTVRIGGNPLDPGTFYLDLGQNTPIGVDGIVLNGGHDLAGNPLTLTVASATGAMRFNGAVSLWSNVLVDTTDGDASFGAQVRFTQFAPIDSQTGEYNDLTLSAGEGNVEFNADLGSLRALDRLEITRADAGVVFGASDEPEIVGDLAPVLAINARGGIDLGSEAVIVGGIVFNAGLDAGLEQVLAIATVGGEVRVNGPVTLASHVSIDTGFLATGDILFTDESTIDSEAGEKNDLVLSAGAASVEFNADLGAAQSLHRLEVTQADGGIIFGGADVAESDSGDRGPVFHVVVEIGIDLGSQAVITDGIFFNAGPGQEIAVTVENGGAQLNGPVWLLSDARIDTASGSGDVTFTVDTPINSQADEYDSLRINAGRGGVFFNANIGTVTGGDYRIGNLIVESSGQIDENTNRLRAFGDIIFFSTRDPLHPTTGNVYIRQVITADPDDTEYATVTADTITITTTGSLIIENGAALQSNRGEDSIDTGQVSNDPPLFRPDPNNPKDVLVPGQRVHTIKGTMGGIEALGDNLERGYNFTLFIYWSDLKSTVIPHIHAGDRVELFVDEDGVGDAVITHESETGPIQFTLQRKYSLAYLETVETTVETWMIMANDTKIFLDDVRAVNLNETSAVRGVKVVADMFRYGEQIPEYLQPAPIRSPEQPRLLAATVSLQAEDKATRQDELRPPSEEGAEKVRVWYLVRVLPRGEEVDKTPIPEGIASDPVALFQSLREMGLPDGRYRIYLEELGFPRRLVYEFYKSGNSIGDPVRERGPGSNPIQQEKPAAAPQGKQGASLLHPSPVTTTAGEFGETIWITASQGSRPADGHGAEDWPDAGSDAEPLFVGQHWATNTPLADNDDETGSRPTAAGPEDSDAALAHPAGVAAVAALGDWRSWASSRPGARCVDQAIERCPEQALTRAARLRRRLKASIRSIFAPSIGSAEE